MILIAPPFNHISHTPSPKHTSLHANKPIGVQNQLVEFSSSEQSSPLNTMLEPPIDVSSGKATSSSSELEYDATGFDAHLDLKSLKFSPDINLISVIPIQVVSPLVQSTHQSCYISEVEHVILIQPDITLPSENYQSSQPSPPTSPLREPNHAQG